jgi:hypothetical protein
VGGGRGLQRELDTLGLRSYIQTPLFLNEMICRFPACSQKEKKYGLLMYKSYRIDLYFALLV